MFVSVFVHTGSHFSVLCLIISLDIFISSFKTIRHSPAVNMLIQIGLSTLQIRAEFTAVLFLAKYVE